VRVSVATTISEVEDLRPTWERIAAHSSGTMFQSFDWNLLALHTFTEEKPYFIHAEDEDSAAIIPAVVRDGTLKLAGGPLFDYRDAVATADGRALWAALKEVADLELSWKIDGVLSPQQWSPFAAQPWTTAPGVFLRDISAAAFAYRHTRSRRALRRLCHLGAQERRLPAARDLLEHIYREKAKEPHVYGENIFRDERCIQFMREVIELRGTSCEIFLMEIAGEPIAALVTFLDGAVRRFYTTWMDPRWSRHSPGIALLYHATCETLTEGFDCDYMTGEQPYKMRFATGSTPLYRIDTTVVHHISREEAELPRAA